MLNAYTLSVKEIYKFCQINMPYHEFTKLPDFIKYWRGVVYHKHKQEKDFWCVPPEIHPALKAPVEVILNNIYLKQFGQKCPFLPLLEESTEKKLRKDVQWLN